MPDSYGQFCPVAQAAEVLTERWTLLVLRELLMGSTRFNEIQRGVPRMSSSLLSKRLRELERSELLTREPLKGERGYAYRLTPAGEALGPLVVSLGTWSRDHLKREISAEEADPALLMWDLRRSVRLDRLPQDQVVVFFRFRDAEEGKRAWWLVGRGGERRTLLLRSRLRDPPSGRRRDPGAGRGLGRTQELGAAMRSKRVRLTGPEHLVRSVPEWIGLSTFAYPDPAAELAARQA